MRFDCAAKMGRNKAMWKWRVYDLTKSMHQVKDLRKDYVDRREL